MHSKDGLQTLVEFATAEHSQENLLFLWEVQSFRTAAGSGMSEDARQAAAAIIDKFLWQRAKSKVNLPSEELADFASRSDQHGYTFSSSMFDAAYILIDRQPIFGRLAAEPMSAFWVGIAQEIPGTLKKCVESILLALSCTAAGTPA